MQISSVIDEYETEYSHREKKEVRILNLNYRDITEIGFIREKYRMIAELYLNHNMIESLDGIEQFPFLKVLSIKFNMISTVDQFDRILNKKCLVSLNIIGNPIEQDPRCSYDHFAGIFTNLKEYNDKLVGFISDHKFKPKFVDSSDIFTKQPKINQVADEVEYKELLRRDFESKVAEKLNHELKSYHHSKQSSLSSPLNPFSPTSSLTRTRRMETDYYSTYKAEKDVENNYKYDIGTDSQRQYEREHRNQQSYRNYRRQNTYNGPTHSRASTQVGYVLTDIDKYICDSSRVETQTATFANSNTEKFHAKTMDMRDSHGTSDTSSRQTSVTNRMSHINLSPLNLNMFDNSMNKSIGLFCTEDYTVKRESSKPRTPTELRVRDTARNTSKNSFVRQNSPNKSLSKSREMNDLLNTPSLENKSSLTLGNPNDQSSFNLLDKHIGNIEKDIESLAEMFYSKLLKERVMKALKLNREESAENLDKAAQFSMNSLMIKFFYAWVYYINTNKRKSVLFQTISSITTKIPKPNTFNNPAVQYSSTNRVDSSQQYRKGSLLNYSEGRFDEYDGGGI